MTPTTSGVKRSRQAPAIAASAARPSSTTIDGDVAWPPARPARSACRRRRVTTSAAAPAAAAVAEEAMAVGALAGQREEGLAAADPARVDGAAPDASARTPSTPAGRRRRPPARRRRKPIAVPALAGRRPPRSATAGTGRPARRSSVASITAPGAPRGGMPSVSMTSTAMRRKSSYEVILSCSTPWPATRGLACPMRTAIDGRRLVARLPT